MNYWTIKVYSKDGKTRITDKWLKSLPAGAQAEITTTLRYLQTQELWGRPYSAQLRGKFSLIHELRIKWQRNQYRPLGFFGPNEDEFTLLIGAIEKGSNFEPKNAPASADERRKLVLGDKKYAIKYFKEL
jgi:hypothetical protein